MLRKTIIIRQEYIKPQLVFEEIEYEGKVMNVSGDNENTDQGQGDAEEDAKQATFIFDDNETIEADIDF